MSVLSYRLGQSLSWLFMKTVASVYCSQQEPLPSQGPLLLFSNHISHFDPPALTMNTRLVINYMTDHHILQLPWAGKILQSWETFPIDRSRADRQAVKTALSRLKKGRVVGLFPEGGIRYRSDSILRGAPFPASAISLWQMAQCPALVACIIGTDQLYQWRRFFKRPRVFVRFSSLLPAPSRSESREILATQLAAHFQQLYKEITNQYDIQPYELPCSAQERWKV